MRRTFWISAVALSCTIVNAGVSHAAPIVYGFEAPEFMLNQTTPILNAPPDGAGPATFKTSFTDAIDANGYVISNQLMNNLMVSQALLEPSATSPLNLSFSTPVTQLSVDFAVDTSQASPGILQLVTPSGTVDLTSSDVGGGFPGGTLTFTAAIPFSTATLQGFQSDGTTVTQIEIDNLQLTPAAASSVPEPASVGLLGIAAAAFFAWQRKHRMSPAA